MEILSSPSLVLTLIALISLAASIFPAFKKLRSILPNSFAKIFFFGVSIGWLLFGQPIVTRASYLIHGTHSAAQELKHSPLAYAPVEVLYLYNTALVALLFWAVFFTFRRLAT